MNLEGSAKVVLLAMCSNATIASSKLAAALYTNSSSMFSEAIHSFADLMNECLLFWGIQRSIRAPDDEHPYGFSREKYAWSLVSGCGIFFLGCGVSVYHGVSALMLQQHSLQHTSIAFGVLGMTLLFEGGTMFAAFRQVKASAKATNVSFKEYCTSMT